MANNCKNCGKDVVSVPGRRPKEYCNSKCRNEYWKKNAAQKEPKIIQSQNPEEIPAWVKQYFIDHPEALVTTKGKIQKLHTEPKELSVLQDEEKEVVVITLERLREMCPKELSGLDRTMWIQEQRNKYGI